MDRVTREEEDMLEEYRVKRHQSYLLSGLLDAHGINEYPDTESARSRLKLEDDAWAPSGSPTAVGTPVLSPAESAQVDEGQANLDQPAAHRLGAGCASEEKGERE